jgi:hypothetical protein
MISPLIRNSLKLYVEQKIETGSFLRAVLENDLKEACGRADFNNQHNLFHIVSYLYNNVPPECWGSKEKVKNWLSPQNENNGR